MKKRVYLFIVLLLLLSISVYGGIIIESEDFALTIIH